MDTKETLIRIVLVALLLYAAVCLALSGRELYTAEAARAALRQELEAVERENLALDRKLREGWSAEELESLARERLGLVRPGDKIFRFDREPEAG
ncbi:MAG: septum formation initiator family protein [Oscillospiraceae bacterium]|nr:septum formation initiator family protein [Oscillospiraceae bacterium]